MAQLFSQGGRANKPSPATALRIQSALQGQPISILLGGQNRISGNLIDYVDFKAKAASSGSGKGGIGGGGGKGQAGTGYDYSVAVIIALCEGPIAGVLQVWNQKTSQTLASLNFTTFLGTYSQDPWGYMVSAHPERALGYRGIAYVAAGPLSLGNVSELPNLSFEVKSTRADAISGAPDADPKDCVVSLLSDQKFGCSFPADLIGDLSVFSSYCRATGMVVSPVVAGQTSAQSFLKDFLEALNSEAVWSNGTLNIVPYGDEAITANGATYTPDLTPLFDFTDDDFVENQGTSTSGGVDDLVIVSNVPQTEKKNWIQVEYLDRAASPSDTGESRAYNPAVVDAKDDASINLFGPLPADKKQYHFFCIASAAKMSASLLLGRQQLPGPRVFTVGPKFIQLDPMDIVTATDLGVGFDRTPLRIKEITENEDYSLTFVCEELLIGAAAAPHYGQQANSGNVPNYNVDPGALNAPVIFEPTDQLSGGVLEIWMALSGAETDKWGGCFIYASTDGDTYSQVGKVTGAARMGVLTAELPPVTPNPTGQTIDTANTLAVDLSESAGSLTSGSQADALALNTLCYVNGEYIAYQTASLTGENSYDLTYLVRGGFGTEAEIADHASGSPFVRVDDALAKIPFTQDRIGQNVFFKFASFNIYGGGQQSLDEVDAVSYRVRGTALSSPLPNVPNLRTSFISDRVFIDWDEVKDFRPVRYEIRVGSSWSSAITLGTVAHPPFAVQGDGIYWVAAVSQPIAGLTVYSEDPSSIQVTGAVLTSFVITEFDEQGLGWPGTFDNAEVSGPFITTSSGHSSGSYEQPESHWIDGKYPRPIQINAAWTGTGTPPDQNVLTMTDFLNQADILGSGSTQFVSVWVEIAVAQNAGNTDIFEPTDIFAPSDVFFPTPPDFGPWQKFSPGIYFGRLAKLRMMLETADETKAIPFGLAFKVTASVQARVDHVMGLTLDTGGTEISFTPDGASGPVPFNGGPNGAENPFPQVFIMDMQPGDTIVLSGLSVSSVTVQVTNGGVGQNRTVNVIVTGW